MPIANGDDLQDDGVVQHGRWTVVVPPAEVDPSTVPELRATLDGLRTSGTSQVAVDWTEVTFFDSSAIGVLVGTHRELNEAGGQLAVVCESGSRRRLFDLMGLDQVFMFVSSIDELD